VVKYKAAIGVGCSEEFKEHWIVVMRSSERRGLCIPNRLF
jgi:hypothetical protein